LPLGEGGANITVSTPVIMQMETMSAYETVISAENQELIDSENKKRGVSISKMWIYPGQKILLT